MDQDIYRFQIWAYAAALGKSRAYLAYLRHDALVAYAPMDLLLTGQEAQELARGIRDAIYVAKPSPANCGRCEFSRICPVATVDEVSEQAVA
jgi:ATP-dependent helicase/nuclease subunit A